MEAIKLNLFDKNLHSDYYRNLPTCGVVEFGLTFLNTKKRQKNRTPYLQALKHLQNYQELTGTVFKTNELSGEELQMFADFMHEKGLKLSTIAGMVSKIKYLLKKAYQNGWQVDDSYDDIVIRENEVHAIYLTEKEIARIYYATGLTKKQQEIRDVFVVGCMTGQRYSDYSHLSTDNVRGDFIHVLQQKTKNKAVVPMTDYVREIFAKYGGRLPKPRCIQYFNKSIKYICKNIGMTDQVTYEEERAGKIVMIKKGKWEMISSHTARRSFVTNAIHSNFNQSQIMKCTGHASAESFQRYDRMDLESSARLVAGHGFLR